MSEVLVEYVNLTIMLITGLHIIRRTLDLDRLIDIKKIWVFFLNIVPILVFHAEYQSLYTLVAFLINIIIFKVVFNQDLQKTIILTIFVMIIAMIADLTCGIISMNFIDLKSLRTTWYIRLILNIIVNIISIIICEIMYRLKLLKKVNELSNTKNNKSTITFITLTFIIIVIFVYNLYINFKYGNEYLLNIILITIFMIIFYIFIRDRNNYNKLISEYDNLFNYIQNFEDWIEKEQLNRHEYKNQLAILRDMTKERNLKTKIDEILEDNINIEGNIINKLKNLPKGGIKGLIYYKLVIAKKKKANITIDVSLKTRTILNKLNEKQNRDLCKLIGIYFDNAIEAAINTRKKTILIEIYELKDKVNLVFSNTYKKTKNFDRRKERGVSSKGKNRGNGIYFANKIISKNKWLEEKQEIIDKYYIEKISILKPEK